MKDRYNRIYNYGRVEFYLSEFMPDEDQCRFIILKVLEQAVRDFTSLADSFLPHDKEVWQEAKDFLFDNEYKLLWGDWELTTEEFLQLVDLDIEWVREQSLKKLKER
jgi:hypothetical protein